MPRRIGSDAMAQTGRADQDREVPKLKHEPAIPKAADPLLQNYENPPLFGFTPRVILTPRTFCTVGGFRHAHSVLGLSLATGSGLRVFHAILICLLGSSISRVGIVGRLRSSVRLRRSHSV